MAGARFFLFVLVLAAVGALLTLWLYPIIKKWWYDYTDRIDAKNKAVEAEHKMNQMDLEDDDDDDDQEKYY